MTSSVDSGERSCMRYLAPNILRIRKSLICCSVVLIGVSWFHNVFNGPRPSHYLQRRMEAKTDSESEGMNILQRLLKGRHDAEQSKPIMYTFVPSSSPSHHAKVEVWADSWNKAGWNTVVLTMDDAKKNPKFKVVDEMSDKDVHHYRYYRYLAMCTLPDGGWFSETFVLPLFPNKDKQNGFKLPNDGKFTIYDENTPDLISANKEEWNRITDALLNDLGQSNDVISFINFRKQDPTSFLTSNEVVGAEKLHNSQKLVDDFCGVTMQKRAISFSHEYLRRSGVTDKEYQSMVRSLVATWKVTCRSSRPVMHTFFHPAYKNYQKLLDELTLWKKAWRAAGWEPVVLTLDDAKRHPLFEQFHDTFERAEHQIGEYDRMCFYRWLAMATSGGGWMSDYDAFPVQSKPFADALTLPNRGQFTGFHNHVPCLVSGSQPEWNRMSTLMLHSYMNHTTDFWSDMYALLEVHQTHNGYVHANEVVACDYIYKDDINKDGQVLNPFTLEDKCRQVSGKRAIHFSHASCGKVGFCHKNRSDAVGKWIDEWRKQCTV